MEPCENAHLLTNIFPVKIQQMNGHQGDDTCSLEDTSWMPLILRSDVSHTSGSWALAVFLLNRVSVHCTKPAERYCPLQRTRSLLLAFHDVWNISGILSWWVPSVDTALQIIFPMFLLILWFIKSPCPQMQLHATLFPRTSPVTFHIITG